MLNVQYPLIGNGGLALLLTLLGVGIRSPSDRYQTVLLMSVNSVFKTRPHNHLDVS